MGCEVGGKGLVPFADMTPEEWRQMHRLGIKCVERSEQVADGVFAVRRYIRASDLAKLRKEASNG